MFDLFNRRLVDELTKDRAKLQNELRRSEELIGEIFLTITSGTLNDKALIALIKKGVGLYDPQMVARRSNLSIEYLEAVLITANQWCGSLGAQMAAACNHRPEVLAWLYKTRGTDYDVLHALESNPYTPSDIVLKIKSNEDFQEAVAQGQTQFETGGGDFQAQVRVDAGEIARRRARKYAPY